MEYTKQNGAKAGLEKKLKYFQDKDYQYEYGVTIGMCMNIAAQLGDFEVDKIKKIFELALALKLDPGMVKTFDEYYDKKKTSLSETVVEVTP